MTAGRTLGLFEQARKITGRNDPDTSFEAAVKVVKSDLRETMHGRILNALKNANKDLTAKEIAAEVAGVGVHWQFVYHAVARRLNELVKMDKIETAGERISLVGGGKLTAYRTKVKI
jgi:hypothetical protein